MRGSRAPLVISCVLSSNSPFPPRNCRLVHHQTMRELEQTAIYQRRILAAAVQLVRPGGALVFSTCSINPGEALLFVFGLNCRSTAVETGCAGSVTAVHSCVRTAVSARLGGCTEGRWARRRQRANLSCRACPLHGIMASTASSCACR